MNETDEIKAFFRDDLFAMGMGIQIEKASAEESICSFAVTASHLNAAGSVQGGAIFTLADFTFAVAANYHGRRAVSQSASVSFLKPGQGTRLYAVAQRLSEGKNTCHYSVKVHNEKNVLIAHVTVNGFILEKREQ